MNETIATFCLFLLKTYGPELIGASILAFTLGYFYNKSSIQDGLRMLCFAFYSLVFKDLILVTYQISNFVDWYIIPDVIYVWTNLSFICLATSLFLGSALKILRLLFGGITFSIVCSLFLMLAGYAVQQNSRFVHLFDFLPNIYISSAFIGLGIALVFVQSAKQTNALKAAGLGFLILGGYYAQAGLLGNADWFWQAIAYSIVLFLSLASQISVIGTYCITLEKTIIAERARRDLLINASPFPILISRLLDDSILIINPKAQKLFDLKDDELYRFSFSSYFADPVKRTELISRIKRESVIEDFEVQLKDPHTHKTFWVALSSRVIDLDGELALYTTFKDITTRKVKESELYNEASTDPLTGLFNRRQFEVMAKKELAKAWRYQTPCCVLMIDIDHFKKVNDTYGHPMGDEVLKHIAMELKAGLRETDILARFGGEEFIILLAHTEAPNAFEVADRLRESVKNNPLQMDGKTIKVTISIGIASDAGFEELTKMIEAADEALYQSKQTGRNKATLYKGKK